MAPSAPPCIMPADGLRERAAADTLRATPSSRFRSAQNPLSPSSRPPAAGHLRHLVGRLHFGGGGREMLRAALAVRTLGYVYGNGVKVGHRPPGPPARQKASPPALLLAASRSS